MGIYLEHITTDTFQEYYPHWTGDSPPFEAPEGFAWVGGDPAGLEAYTPKPPQVLMDEAFNSLPQEAQDLFEDDWIAVAFYLQQGRFDKARKRIQNKQIPPELSEQAPELEQFRTSILSLIPQAEE